MLEPRLLVARRSSARVTQHVLGREHRLYDARLPSAVHARGDARRRSTDARAGLGFELWLRLRLDRAGTVRLRLVRPGAVAESAAASAASHALSMPEHRSRPRATPGLTRPARSRMFVADYGAA